MKRNMANVDRLIRVLIIAVLATLYFTGTVTGLWGTVALVVAGIFALTSLTGFCPIYAVLGISTCAVKKA